MRIRFTALLSLILAGTFAASAGQIQIGSGGSGSIGGVSVTSLNGLTSSYITSTGGSTEQNYDVTLFSGATPSPTPYSTYSTTTANRGTITDSVADGGAGVTFSMINDGLTSSNSNNFWQVPDADTLTIPVGLADVSDVWTLVNGLDLLTSGRDENITFVFGTTPTGGTLTQLELKLNNTSSGTPGSGQIQNALSCPSISACSGDSNGPPASSTGMTTVSGTGLTAGDPITVLTDLLPTSAYTSATGAYTNTSGNVGLEDEGFIFTGAAATVAANNYLVSIMIKDPEGSTNGTSLGVSAVTVDTVPEPSSAFLLLTGAGLLGFARLRRR